MDFQVKDGLRWEDQAWGYVDDDWKNDKNKIVGLC